MASSIEGGITGFGADWIILDDPHNSSDIFSHALRQNVIDIYHQTITQRLNHAPLGKLLLVMQRLHEQDLAGELWSSGLFRQLMLQAQATEEAQIDVGGSRPRLIRVGDLLDPIRLPLHILDEKRLEMGSLRFAAQYLQAPTATESPYLKKDAIRWYAEPQDLAGMRIVYSCDTAYTDRDHSDYTVIMKWGERAGLHYLLEIYRGRPRFPELLERACGLFTEHPHAILVEDIGSGTILNQNLQAAGLRPIGIKPKGDKLTRLIDITPMFEAGSVYFPKDAPWLAEFLSELLSFPQAKHDDQVDALTQYLSWARGRASSQFEVFWT